MRLVVLVFDFIEKRVCPFKVKLEEAQCDIYIYIKRSPKVNIEYRTIHNKIPKLNVIIL